MAAELERVLQLSEIAVRLEMKRSNVAKFLARRGVRPIIAKSSGYLWREEDIERVKAEREADAERMDADRRRRESAVRRVDGQPGPPVEHVPGPRLGRTQRDLVEELTERPRTATGESRRHAMRRLRFRGLVEAVPGERNLYQLTDSGREIAGQL